MEILEIIWEAAKCIGGFWGGYLIIQTTFFPKQQTVYRCEYGSWFNVNQFPVPDDTAILLTDGSEIRSYRKGDSLDYDKNGKVVFCYNKRVATHWLPYPPLPK